MIYELNVKKDEMSRKLTMLTVCSSETIMTNTIRTIGIGLALTSSTAWCGRRDSRVCASRIIAGSYGCAAI